MGEVIDEACNGNVSNESSFLATRIRRSSYWISQKSFSPIRSSSVIRYDLSIGDNISQIVNPPRKINQFASDDFLIEMPKLEESFIFSKTWTNCLQ